MIIHIFDNAEQIGKAVANMICDQVNEKPNSVLGFATGASPVPTYNHLIKAYKKGKVDDRLVSLIDLPPTMLQFADIYIPSTFSGISILEQEEKGIERDNVFIQISESQVGRAIRTKKYKYSVRAFGNGFTKMNSKVYYEDYLYDLENDPYEKMNLANDKNFKQIRKDLSKQLSDEMEKAWELKPKIRSAVFNRKK